MLCSCNNGNQSAFYERKIKAYRDSADYLGSEYYSSKADMYADSLKQLDIAKKRNDDHIKDTPASIANR